MNHISRSAVIIFFVIHAKAQNYGSSTQQSTRNLHSSLAVVFGVLSILFSITFLLLAYVRFCLAGAYSLPNDEEIPQEFLRHGSRFSGIDRKVVESLPFFRFSSLKGHKEGLECAVCLSKFEENETLRLMPKCRHAFHINCIDKWLESHSSCPICRNRFEADELTNFPITGSLRYCLSSLNKSEEQNVQFSVEREENDDHNNRRSSRFNLMVSSLRRLSVRWKADQFVQKDADILHKFKHRIIVSDLISKSRWSDLNSSDLTFLNSEMLNYESSKRFSPAKSQSFNGRFQIDEDLLKIKEDLERKRVFESRVGKSTSDSPDISNRFVQDQEHISKNLLNPGEKRAMSEIVRLPRHTNSIGRSRNNEPLSRNDRIRSLWLPIAKSTVQWFNGRESALEFKKSHINV